MKNPLYKVGQCVAWCASDGRALAFFRIATIECDDQMQTWRYKFCPCAIDSSFTESLCPIESLLRPLTAEERGPKGRPGRNRNAKP